MQEITLSLEGPLATVTLHRPAALNALTPSMLDELNEAFDALRADPAVRMVVLTGSGRAFSAGVDLKSLGARGITAGAVGEILDVPGRRLLATMESMPKLVVGKVNGFCFTGALELLLACDLIVCAEEATFGDTHTRWGIRPSWGMSQRLPRRVGIMKARELSYTARSFSGREAASMGLANQAVPAAELDAAVAHLCASILANSHDALAAYKDLYRNTEGLPLDHGLAYEADTTYDIGDSDERLAQFLSR